MNESTKWLYGKLTSRGLNVGTEDEFERLMKENEESRKWAYNKATNMGLNVGDYEQFEGLVAPSAPSAEEIAEEMKPKEADGGFLGALKKHGAQMGSPSTYTPMPSVRETEEITEEQRNAQAEMREYLKETGVIDAMEESKKEARKNKWSALGQMMAGAGSPSAFIPNINGQSWDKTQQGAQEYTQNKLMQQTLDEALDMARQGELNMDGASGMGNFLRGVWDEATRMSTWDMGYTDVINGLTLNQLVQKYENGEELAATEKKVLEALGMSMAVQEAYAGTTGIGYAVGQSVPHSASFMATMAMNPASGLGKTLARNTVKKVGRQGVKAALARGAARAGGDILETAIMTGTVGLGRVSADALERINGSSEYYINPDGYIMYGGQKDQEEVAKAWWKAFGTSFIEGYTEALGNAVFDPMLDAMKGVIRGGVKKEALNQMGEAILNVEPSRLATAMRGLKKVAKVDSMIGELLEEEVGMMLNWWDNAWTQEAADRDGKSYIFDLENQLTTLISTCLMTGAINGAEAVGDWKVKRRINKDANDADLRGRAMFGDGWEAFSTKIDQGTPEDVVNTLRDAFTDPTMSHEKKRALLEYASKRVTAQYYNAEESKVRRGLVKEQQQLQDAFEVGYNSYLPAFYNMRKAADEASKNLEEYAEKNGRSEVIIATIQEAMADPARMREVIGALPNEEQDLVYEYIYSNARMNGAYQGRSDKLEDYVDEYAFALEPFVVTDAEGNRTITTANIQHGDKLEPVYVVANDGTNAYIMRPDGSTTSEPILVKDLKNMVTRGADDTIEMYRQQATATMQNETENAETYRQGVQDPVVGMQLTKDGKMFIVESVDGDNVMVAPAKYNPKTKQYEATGGDVQNKTVAEVKKWQNDNIEAEEAKKNFQKGTEQTLYINGEEVKAEITNIDADGNYQVELDRDVEGMDRVGMYTLDELRKLATTSTQTINMSANEAQNEGAPTEEIKQSVSTEVANGQNTPIEKYNLSDEVDENGRQFVLTASGGIEFGRIGADTGLSEAPILLSEGIITNPETNDGYGLVHIEARHGDQIRKAGYKSVVEFIEEVAKNYEVIREGINRNGHQTYMLQLTDKHNNTLMVELSGDGTYWNINTAGIFKTSYGRNRKEVYNRHTTDKQSTETVGVSQNDEQGGTQSNSSMNTPTLQYSNTKGSGNVSDLQGNGQENNLNPSNLVAGQNIPTPIAYEQVDADTAWDDILAKSKGNVDVAQEVANEMLANKKKALANAKKSKPKSGNTVDEILANKEAHALKIAQAEADVKAWEKIASVNARRVEEARTEAERLADELASAKTIAEGIDKLGEPQSLYEYVLMTLAGGGAKIKWDDKPNGTKGFGSHTGLSTKEMQKRLSMIDNTNGYTPEELAHSIVENMDMSFGDVDVMDVTDMVIDIIASNNSRGEMLNSLVRAREELIRQREAEDQRQKDEYYMDTYHATEDELVAYNEYLTEFAEIIYGEDVDYENRIAIFAEQFNEYDYEGRDAGIRSSADTGEGLTTDREGGRSMGETEQSDRREVLSDADRVAEAEDEGTGRGVLEESDVEAKEWEAVTIQRIEELESEIADLENGISELEDAIEASDSEVEKEALEDAIVAMKTRLNEADAEHDGLLSLQTEEWVADRYHQQYLEDEGIKDENAPTHTREDLGNGKVRITNTSSNGEIATVAIEQDGKIVSVDSYDNGLLFERTNYDENGQATKVTRYKNGKVVREEEYTDGKRKVTSDAFEMAEEVKKKHENKKSNEQEERKESRFMRKRSEGTQNAVLPRASAFSARHLHQGRAESPTDEAMAVIRSVNKGKTLLAQNDFERGWLKELRRMTNDEIDSLLETCEEIANNPKSKDRNEADALAALIRRFKKRGEREAIIETITGAKAGENISLSKIDELFNGSNSDANVAELYGRVRAIAEKIGLEFVFDDTMEDNQLGGYNIATNRVRLNPHMLYTTLVDQQTLATTILHEMLHSVASYAVKTQRMVRVGLTPPVELPNNVLQAANTLINIYYDVVKDNRKLRHREYDEESGKMITVADYGTKSVNEMISELADPEFREKLKKIKYRKRSVLEVIKDVFKRMFSKSSDVTETPSAYDMMAKAVDELIENFSQEGYREAAQDELYWEPQSKTVTDKATIEALEASPKRTGFRNVVLNEDGTFSSPMAYALQHTKGGAKTRIKMDNIEMGKWEEAIEYIDLVDENGKIALVKPNNDALDVAYDPYIHNRLEPVNFQFKSAWERDELVYIRTEVAEIDLNSGFHADKAALPVGTHSWSNGALMLSKYDKPVEILPWEEVADAWVERLKRDGKTGVRFEIVPAVMRPLLVERGVEILPPTANMGKRCNEAYKAWKAGEGVLFRGDDKTLVGLHNISEDKLKKALKMGGLANPSMAVIDVNKQGHEGYGDITLIAPSSLVDKKTGRNIGTYTADAWTPIYPNVEKQMSDKGVSKFYKDIESIPEELRSKVSLYFRAYLEDGGLSGAMYYWFLNDTGRSPEVLTHQIEGYTEDELNAIEAIGEDRLYTMNDEQKQKVVDLYIESQGGKEAHDEKIAKRIEVMKNNLQREDITPLMEQKVEKKLKEIQEYGYDYNKVSEYFEGAKRNLYYRGKVNETDTFRNAENVVKNEGLQQEFNDWLSNKEDKYGVKEYIFVGYNNNGDRKYIPNTLENASKVMREDGRAGATGLSGFNKFIAILAPNAGSLAQIRKKKGNLSTEEEYQGFRDKWGDVYHELAQALQPDANGYSDYGYYRLEEMPTVSNPKQYVKKEYGIELTDEFMQKYNDFVSAVKNDFPARYFETKFERPVYLNEFAAAVVPTGTSQEVVDALRDSGLEVVEYEQGNEDARAEAVRKTSKEIEGVRFRDGEGEVSDKEVSYQNDPIAKWMGKPRYYGKKASEFAERERGRMVQAVNEVSESLGLKVEVVTDTKKISQGNKQTLREHPRAN